jgi:hypothetical protein
VIYVYAIADGAGSAEQPLRELAYGDVTAVYREVASIPDATEESLRDQEHVLEQLMEKREILPLRFGSTVEDEDELRQVLATRHDEFAVALARVRGRVEMGVRGTAAVVGSQSAASGREYLTRKLEGRRVAAGAAEGLHAELSQIAHASSLRVASEPALGFAASYLVDRERVAEFRSRCEAASGVRPDLELACTGPWPPYSFVSAEERA